YHDMSIEEANDEIAQQAAEAAMQEPVVREVYAKDAMESLGMHKELAAIEEAQRLEAEKAKGLLKNNPPIQQGEKITTGEVKKRGRTQAGLEPSPTPQEHKVEGRA
ncbi:unnamed protein product, partial [marine sediment metagenome]